MLSNFFRETDQTARNQNRNLEEHLEFARDLQTMHANMMNFEDHPVSIVVGVSVLRLLPIGAEILTMRKPRLAVPSSPESQVPL